MRENAAAEEADTRTLIEIRGEFEEGAPVTEVAGNRSATSIFDDYFVREQEGGRTVVKLHEQHVSFQVVDLAQNFRLFTEARAALMIAYGSQ